MTNKHLNKQYKDLFTIGFLIFGMFLGGQFVFAMVTAPADIQRRLDEVRIETERELNQTKRENQIRSGMVIIENTIEIQKRLIKTKVKSRFKELATIVNTKELEVHVKSKRQETDAKLQKSRLQFEEDIKNKDLNTKEVLEQKNQETLAFAKERQQIFDMDSSFRKEEMETKLAEVQKELQNNLLKIQDEEKRTRVFEIATDFQSVNRKAMDKFAKDIDKVDLILSKSESQVDQVVVGGQSVQNLRFLLDNAGNSITNARSAIAVQYGKVYQVNIKNEESLKSEMATTRDILQADINSVGLKVQIAVSAVRTLSDAIKKVPGINTSDSGSLINDNNTFKAQ